MQQAGFSGNVAPGQEGTAKRSHKFMLIRVHDALHTKILGFSLIIFRHIHAYVAT
jgi:hypothetical protein